MGFYIKDKEEKLLAEVVREDLFDDSEDPKKMKGEAVKKHKVAFEVKTLHSKFIKETSDVRDDKILCKNSMKDNLADCLKAGKVPEWMTKGKTALIQKDPAKGNDSSNYRPITCLPLAWKILTGIIEEETYTFLEQRSLLPEEQKGCRKGSRGTGDLLYIDRMLLQEVKRRNKNLAMAWIDYRKAYDLVPHSWILECLENLGVNEEIRRIVKESMKSWKVELTYGNDVLGEVKIERGIFQGDSLSPLLFVIILIPLTHILRKASPGYEFASSKEKINHFLYMDDLKLYSKTEKTLDSLIHTVRIFSNDIYTPTTRYEYNTKQRRVMKSKIHN